MILSLHRFATAPDFTLGALSVEGVFECFSLEDEARAVKVAGETRIPAGRYEIKLQTAGRLHDKYAGKFPEHEGMLTLQSVPGFEGVMLHVGNSTAHTAGCILLGDTATSSGSLAGSAAAYRRVYSLVLPALKRGDPVFIEVGDL